MPSVNVEFNADATNLNVAIASVRANIMQMTQSTNAAFFNMKNTTLSVSKSMAVAMTTAFQAMKAAAAAFSEAWTQAARFEDASVRLAPFVGGLKQSRDVCESLRREAANGVMSFEELAGVAGKLATVFSNTSDVKKWTTVFHDLAAGTGINVETLVEQFVKSKASGTVSTNFLDVFARKGVNIFAVLAQNVGTTENAIKEMAKNGEISLAQLETALTALTSAGGQFAGMAKKMSSTAQGSLNSLKANFDIVLAKLAEPVAEAITPALQRIAAMFGNVAPLAGKLGSGAVSAMKGVVAATEKVIEILAQAAEIVAVVAGAFVGVQKGVEIATAVVSNFGVIVATAKAAAISAISAIAKGFVIVVTRIQAATTAMLKFVAANKGASIAAGAAIAYEGVSFILDRYVEQSRSASERLDRMYAQLNEAQTEFFSAKSPEALDKAYAKVTAAIERLRTEGAKLHAELGTKSGFNFDALSKIRADEYTERRGGIAEEARAAEAEAARIEAINRFLDFRQKSQEQIDNITASTKTISDQREDVLGGVHEDDLASVEASLDALRQKNGLSDQEYQHALKLIDAKQKLLELDQASAQTKDAYHQKIILLQAELEGTEALAAAKEKLHKAELEKQGIAAGFSNADASAVAQATIELEKQVEAKKAADALAEYNKDTEIIAAENSGQKDVADQLRDEKSLQEEILKLRRLGVDAVEAEIAATARLEAEKRKEAAASSAQQTPVRVASGEVRRLENRYGYSSSMAYASAQATAALQAMLKQSAASAQKGGESGTAATASGASTSNGATAARGSLSQNGATQSAPSTLLAVAQSQLNILTQIKTFVGTIAENRTSATAVLA